MAVKMSVLLCLAIIAAAVYAAEEAKPKRDIIYGAYPYAAYPSPAVAYAAPGAYAVPAAYAAAPAAYAAPAVAYAAPVYDDGKYFPGKYEKPTFYSAVRPAAAVVYA